VHSLAFFIFQAVNGGFQYVNDVSVSLYCVSVLPFVISNFVFQLIDLNHNKMLLGDSIEQATLWENQKEKLRRKFSVLCDADLSFTQEQKIEMLLRLKAKLGLSVERLQLIMSGNDRRH
jgi:hypothetical protein